ncbi:IgaA/UmoB family intracellular growth attenuator [Variovorax sp. GB1P17]|uniref:IgaA/UmoB family intracellular growth attenuator n=1 Tax=Variovorax sp. GB1P17 TaxID=3443740 RepID=UPI003F46D780
MDTVIIVLKVGLILYAIYSVIVYAARRSGNRSAFKDFHSAPVLRRITDEEKSALQPFLIGQGLTADDDVRELTGGFVRHGLQSQGSSTEHDTIGAVDVLLPYDAIDYIEAHNEALVVLSKKCAVVIRLNRFDLLEGRQRAQRQQAQDQQWKRGEVGALPNIEEPVEGADPLAAGAVPEAAFVATDPNARFQRGEVDILSQRTETPDEVASRVGRGQGWTSALVWLVAFILLWLATWDATRDVHVYLLGAGLIAGLCAAWLFLRKPSDTAPVRQPQPVNRVRGMLNQIAVVNASNASIKRVGLFIGDKLSFVLPSAWSNAKDMPYGEVIEAELRTSDYSAVSFGDKWSVAEEWRRFRPVFWGRHLLHLLIGLLAAGALALSSPDLRGQMALVVQWFSHDRNPEYTDARQLADNPPKWASYASVKGEGRCEIDLSHKGDDNRVLPMIDCTSVRWNGSAPVVPELKIPESIQALASRDFIRASENGMAASLIEMLRMQMGQAPDPLAAYRARENTPMVVRHFDRSVAFIEAACKEGEGLAPGDCAALQRAVVNAAEATVEKDGTDTSIHNWKELAASAQPGKENADLVVSRRQLASMQHAARQAVDSFVATRIEAAIPSIVPAKGGVVLASTAPIGAVQRKAGDGDSTDVAGAADVDAAVAVADDDGDTSMLGRWASLQRNAAPEGVKPFVLAGLVTARGSDESGAPILRIDPGLEPAQAASAGAYALWWLFAVGLLLVNGVLFVLRLTQSLGRGTRLQADIQSRPAPGTTGLF